MTVTPAFFGPTNVFIPSATGQMIGYIRTPGKFRLLDYVQMVGSKSTDTAGKPICAYAILDPDEPVRVGPSTGPTVTNPDIQGYYGPSSDVQFRWAPGDDAPRGNILPNFKWQTVEMLRRAYPYEFDEQTEKSADIPVQNVYREIATSKAMTIKTQRVVFMLQASGNWPAQNVADANTLNGGKGRWGAASSDEQSPNFCAIRLAVAQACTNIVLYTNGAVRPEDMRAIISPNAALRMGSSGEIYNFVKSSSFSEQRQEGKNQLNEQYLMPKYYAGIEWIIEDAPYVSDEANAAQTTATSGRAFIKNDSTCVLVSRKGGLNGVYGAPSFSTVQIFYYRYEMAVEEVFDSWNKKHKGRVVDQFAEALAATRAGYLITNIL